MALKPWFQCQYKILQLKRYILQASNAEITTLFAHDFIGCLFPPFFCKQILLKYRVVSS